MSTPNSKILVNLYELRSAPDLNFLSYATALAACFSAMSDNLPNSLTSLFPKVTIYVIKHSLEIEEKLSDS